MPKRNVLVGDDNRSQEDFLGQYFSETKSIPIFAKSKQDLVEGLPMMMPDFVFVKADWVDEETIPILQQFHKEHPAVKFFSLGFVKEGVLNWVNPFEVPLELRTFQKKLLSEVSVPPKIKLLVVDDEEGILGIFKNFFELQREPAFELEFARNGLEGFRKVEKMNPDCIVLDIKMPVRSGIEFYGDLHKSGRDIPTIVFIDSTSPDEIAKICKFGNPALVEKSGYRSSMQEMLNIIKKLIAFA